MKGLFTLCYIFFSSFLYCQQHDNVWLFGYNSSVPDVSGFGGSVIDFSIIPADIYYEYRDMEFDFTNSSICDTAGNLLFYSNGLYIANALNEPMENGLGLNPGIVANSYPDGYILAQGVITLPAPDHNKYYYLVHANLEFPQEEWSLHTSKLYYSKIDMNQGLGVVTKKNEVVAEDIMEPGKLTACKHANGRDWWLFMRRYSSNEHHTFLLTPSGFETQAIQAIGDSIPSPGLGQSIFSPDGNKFVELSLYSFEEGNFLNIYDFDRCTGELSNPVHISYTDGAASGGVAISPNSRFLYVSSFHYIYQYDLWANNIEATKDTVAIYDGFITPPVFATTFFLAQLAPDGKIYLNANNGVKYLHVINNPDLPGGLCDVCQHCVELPTYNGFSMPNFPNYRLGALAGSPCDTLRQPPVATWQYDIEGADATFQDHSYHDIRSWHWDFGDGVTDTAQHPVHTYAVTGSYNVCLTVYNPRGADTLCQQVAVIVNGTTEMANSISANISPNPVSGAAPANLFVELSASVNAGTVIMHDAFGKEMLREPLRARRGKVQQELQMAHLPAGIYFCSIEAEGKVLWKSKIAKQ